MESCISTSISCSNAARLLTSRSVGRGRALSQRTSDANRKMESSAGPKSSAILWETALTTLGNAWQRFSLLTRPGNPDLPLLSFLSAEYMLNPDPEKRPDIYQVASLAFALAGRDNPVQNLNVSAALKCFPFREAFLTWTPSRRIADVG